MRMVTRNFKRFGPRWFYNASMSDFGRILIIIGATMLTIGTLIVIAGRIFPQLGNLPGDYRFEGDGFQLFIPFTTMLVISVLGTILLNILLRFFK